MWVCQIDENKKDEILNYFNHLNIDFKLRERNVITVNVPKTSRNDIINIRLELYEMKCLCKFYYVQ